ncbi:nicotinate-nucleotide adenylyltransferase [Paenibacillus sp. GSMTC-2017]|uniref:nicotinate-nucleotide adenylyltransferase n=1 Tax=Paenibacillus sp. GSMTC-2017 TaxID=2794350 RepID=UPI0018D76046|nr:nicotinate-nucleotide adenylyltransferase [Paenibacillus sp. GSMTC-2017]MBH5317021.1 nicotinate-nucleotide adenylyltransferase [Paenibacillus sp. GSMTC-2017]
MKKIGIMGGTFDPIHIGHLLAAEVAREHCSLNEVWFIPTAGSPLKDNEQRANAVKRYEMVVEAISSNNKFRALDIELKRGGISYSYDTVTELQAIFPDCSFSYIIGSDRINDLPKWNRIEKLAEVVNFIGLERPSEAICMESLPAYLKDRLHLVEMPPIGISSTALRRKLSLGQSVRYSLPDSVLAYIRRHGLYGSN